MYDYLTFCFVLPFVSFLSFTCLAGYPPTQSELNEAVKQARQVRQATLERKERIYDYQKSSYGQMKTLEESNSKSMRIEREAMYKEQERSRTLIPIYYYPVYYPVRYSSRRSITIRY